MSSFDLEGLKAAAMGATARIDAPEDAPAEEDETRSELRKKIEHLLKSGEVDLDEDSVADRVAEKLSKMVWPQREIEIRKKRFEIEVEQRAMTQFLQQEVKEIMRGLRGKG